MEKGIMNIGYRYAYIRNVQGVRQKAKFPFTKGGLMRKSGSFLSNTI